MGIKNKLDQVVEETFINLNLETVIGDRFGRYSKYIIQDRAIPDVRDGLKPVQRRIVYAMGKMGITSKSTYKKSATVVGEVMGKYHPHGDSSIYEAMVRLSQNWKMSVNLVEMHGNNGSIDGDGAAASRYTEVRGTSFSELLLKDIDKNTVNFVLNFSEEEKEPTVLPAKFPNLLVNGSVGISSGYATNIPPHNFNEVINATIKRIDNPNMTIDELLEVMPGPDFPTGGIVQGIEGIKSAFETGSGAVVIKSKINFEQQASEPTKIVITEIPYEINKGKLVEKIEQIRIEKKIDGISEVRDESDKEGLRIAVDLKKGANKEAILNYLLKNTDLQIKYNYNMVSICNRKPEKLGVLQILDYYIEHQKDVITSRTNHELDKAELRLHIVNGLIKMISILDEVIKTIRASKNKQDSKNNLMEKFKFTEIQAEAIVTMQLYRLSSTDILMLEEEKEELGKKIKEYNKILSSEKELLKVIKNELNDINKSIVVNRKSVIEESVEEIKISETDLIANEITVVMVSKDFYVKRCSVKSYTSSSTKQTGLKEDDTLVFEKHISNLNTLLIFTSMGNYVYLPVYKIDESKYKDLGKHVSSYVSVGPNEKVVACYNIESFLGDVYVLLATKNGSIKQTLLQDFEISRYQKAVKAMALSKDDMLVSVDIKESPLEVICVSKTGGAIRMRKSDVSLFKTTAGGIKAYSSKEEMIGAVYANRFDDLVIINEKGYIKRIKVDSLKISSRARSLTPIIKMVKSNPVYCVDAKIMTPQQYKEGVSIYISFEDDNEIISAKDIKYTNTEAGSNILSTQNKKVIGFSLNKALEKDQIVDSSYLDVSAPNLFQIESNDIVDKPIKSNQKNLTDILEDILISEKIVDKEEPKPKSTLFDTNFDDEQEKNITKTKRKEDLTSKTTKKPKNDDIQLETPIISDSSISNKEKHTPKKETKLVDESLFDNLYSKKEVKEKEEFEKKLQEAQKNLDDILGDIISKEIKEEPKMKIVEDNDNKEREKNLDDILGDIISKEIQEEPKSPKMKIVDDNDNKEVEKNLDDILGGIISKEIKEEPKMKIVEDNDNKEVEITKTGDSIIKKTKSSTIVRKVKKEDELPFKKISLFEDD